MNALSWLIFVPLQILFLPITILSALFVAYRQIWISKKLGLSMTAIEVINGRWTMHIFDLREDRATAALAAALPNTSLLGLWLSLLPLWVKYKVSGQQALYPRVPEPGAEAIADLVIARTLYFDRIIERVLEDVEQFVILGAGYDTRAYGDLVRPGISFFELDQTSMQQHKMSMLRAANIASEHVKFVPIDFAQEKAIDKLIDSGFDTSKKTLFLWEGVTLYLSETEVRNMLRDIRTAAAAGSVVVTDLYGSRLLDIGKRGSSKKLLDETGERVDFSLDFAMDHKRVLADFVQSESLSVGETFFMGSNNAKGPYVVVAEIRC